MPETTQKTPSTARFNLSRQSDGTIVIKVTVPWNETDAIREKVIDEAVKNIEVQGFRKGQAPRNISEAKLSKDAIREEMLKRLVSDEYIKAIKELKINPIVNPRIHIEAFEDGTPVEFSAETAEDPKVELKNYKDEVKKIKPAAPKIIVPGQKEQTTETNPNKRLDDILGVVLNTATVTIPKILVEQETNRLLSQLLDELKRLGVSLDQYLASRGKNEENLRKEYDERAEKDLKLEFVLRKIADDEKITVEAKDVDGALAAIKDEKQKAQLMQNPYVVAAIIRQQKTLDFLSKLA